MLHEKHVDIFLSRGGKLWEKDPSKETLTYEHPLKGLGWWRGWGEDSYIIDSYLKMRKGQNVE